MDRVRASRRPRKSPRVNWLPGLLLVLATDFASADPAVSQQDLTTALFEAEQLLERSSAAGYEWLKTAELLDEARTLAAKGQTMEAWQVLEKGRLQAEMALQQAEREAHAWQRRVLR
jgi:hypothetical protein